MNVSFVFTVKDIKYIYRQPGNNTAELINRKNEKSSLEIAHKYGLDTTYIFMDDEEGYKMSFYKDGYRKPDYSNANDSANVIKLLSKLHSLDVSVDYEFKPYEDSIELIRKIDKISKKDASKCADLCNRIHNIYSKVDLNIKNVFSHCDFYRPNILINESDSNDIILIDWEYSAMSVPMVDVAYYIVDAAYDFDKAKDFILCYLHRITDQPSNILELLKKDMEFMSYFLYIPIIAYYWYVWAVYRKVTGFNDVEEYLLKWKDVAYNYLDFIESKI